ncbi:MAG: monovalent cation/H+ antiporter subunit D family protein [Alphaproteobacteria bacterium]|jgi:multicomponent Na+:H+ antiporter subunit D|nr:monovalent cation/H+ antiporter subunit D family protein [Alphaproteobacteria bacterium]
MTLSYLLILIILIPFFSFLTSFRLKRYPNVREGVNIAFAFINFILSIVAYNKFSGGELASFRFITLNQPIYLGFYAEKISMIFALMVNFLWIISIFYSMGYMRGNKEKHQSRFFAFFSLSICFTLGIAFSSNLLTTFLFYEALTLATFPLVAHNINDENRSNVKVYLGVLIITSLILFLPAIIGTLVYLGSIDYTLGGLFIQQESTNIYVVLSLLLLFIFGIAKAGVMPVHKWLPAAMVAPTPVSALLHAVAVVKSGVFILIKIVVYIFGIDYLNVILQKLFAINWILVIPCITIILASLIALSQDNLKKMLAYSTVSQLSYIVLGVLLLTNAGIISSITNILAHAVAKITLFFAAGAIYVIAHKTKISELSGIGRKMPITMTAFSIAALSMIGFPLTGGFIAKWFLLKGIWESSQHWVLFVIIISTVLNALYFLPIIFKAFFEKYHEDEDDNHEGDTTKKSLHMDIAMIASATCVILLYIYSDSFIKILIK